MIYDNPECGEIRDFHGTVYEPWIENGVIGYRIWRLDGEVKYIYFHPSIEDDSYASNVFVYMGEHGDPTLDMPCNYYLTVDKTA